MKKLIIIRYSVFSISRRLIYIKRYENWRRVVLRRAERNLMCIPIYYYVNIHQRHQVPGVSRQFSHALHRFPYKRKYIFTHIIVVALYSTFDGKVTPQAHARCHKDLRDAQFAVEAFTGIVHPSLYDIQGVPRLKCQTLSLYFMGLNKKKILHIKILNS